MKKFVSSMFAIAFIATSSLLTSCGEDTGILEEQFPDYEEPDVTTEYNLKVTPNNATNDAERHLEIKADAGANQVVNVTFESSADENMFRLYTTRNVLGTSEGDEPYQLENFGVDTKADGSVDLQSTDKESFTYALPFKAPDNVGETVQYTLWATHGRGDFRDPTKRNAISEDPIAYGTIRITAGEATGNNSSVDYKEFTTIILAAPLAKGTSDTFLSLFDNQTYPIARQDKEITETYTPAEQEANAEYSALWDLGYFYGATDKASFASAHKYMDVFRGDDGPIVDITRISGLGKDDLNHFYFAKSTMTEADFDAISGNSDLNSIATPGQEFVNDLSTGDIVEFEDGYGNKGLIKVTEVKGTYNEGDYIQFDVKVQVNAIPISL